MAKALTTTFLPVLNTSDTPENSKECPLCHLVY